MSLEHITGVDIGDELEARVREGIERNRKSRCAVRVVDHSGKPVAGVKVSAKQTSSDFLFGCAFPKWSGIPEKLGEEGWANWTRYFTRLFNYSTTENSLKWGFLEPERGKYKWENVDFQLEWCKKHGIKVKGHTLIWSYDSERVIQEWLKTLSQEEVGCLAEERIRNVISRYKEDIRFWDVVNEPVHLHWFGEHWREDYVARSYQIARESDPEAVLILNDYGAFVEGPEKFVSYAKQLLDNGVPIDVIGEQAHDSPVWYSPQQVFHTLDSYASLGLDIHLTELTQPSNDSEVTGGFVQGNWDEEAQANFYRYFLTLAFSHPNVKAITSWAMWDGSSWLPKGGIIRQDWTLKPAYNVWDQLINGEWKTNVESITDSDGKVSFSGFHGNYRVDISLQNTITTSKVTHLREGLDEDLLIKIERKARTHHCKPGPDFS